MHKEEALQMLKGIRGTVEHRLQEGRVAEVAPWLIDMLDDLKDMVENIDECGCHDERE